MDLTWIEISKNALTSNVKAFRRLIPTDAILGVAVKGNAYGHGLITCSKAFLEAGADYLCVNSLEEAKKIREANIKAPLLIMGYVAVKKLEEVSELNCELIVYNIETLEALADIKRKSIIHLKIETGNHRQGIYLKDLGQFAKKIKANKQVEVRGVSTHFANIEDRLNHAYALEQIKKFKEAIQELKKNGIEPAYKHCANTAASILLPEAYFNFVRVGIGAYGMWPSEKTKKGAKRNSIEIELKPALEWKVKIAQIKEVKKGALIGYGCTYRMPHDGKIAVLPVGYYEGYSRALSNKGYVMIKGQKAPVIGRICMNMFMIDVSHLKNLELEDEVTLIGPGVEAEKIAEASGTINYEVTTRIHENIIRKMI